MAGHVQSSSEIALIRDLAFAISECDKILLIDDNNNGKFCNSIDTAVGDELCFAVRPHAGVVTLDFDEPGDLNLVFDETVSYIRGLGGRPVIVASGTVGHLHLFCRIDDEEIQTDIRDFLSSKGVSKWLRVNTFIRPPLSPHRAGLPVSLVEPGSPQRALALLGKSIIKKDLPSDMLMKIKYGLLNQNQYSSGSELTQAIVNSCYLSGYTLEEIFELLSRSENRGGNSLKKRIKERGHSRAMGWLSLSYDKASRFITANNLEEIRKWSSSICDQISRLAINGRRKISLIKIFMAHIDVASRARSYKYNASVRQLAVASSVSSIVTVSRANKQLQELGIVKRITVGREKVASSWELSCSKGGLRDTLGSPCSTSNNHKGCGYDVSSGIHFDHDAFRYSYGSKRGLGAAAAIILGCLLRSDGVRVAQVCRLTGLCRSTVVRGLNRMEGFSLAKSEGFLWTAASGNIDARLDRVAEELGLLGASANQSEKYREERENYLARYSLR